MEADKIKLLMTQILESKTTEDKMKCVDAVCQALNESWDEGAQSAKEIYQKALV